MHVRITVCGRMPPDLTEQVSHALRALNARRIEVVPDKDTTSKDLVVCVAYEVKDSFESLRSSMESALRSVFPKDQILVQAKSGEYLPFAERVRSSF